MPHSRNGLTAEELFMRSGREFLLEMLCVLGLAAEAGAVLPVKRKNGSVGCSGK
jgi:hypothetical protein